MAILANHETVDTQLYVYCANIYHWTSGVAQQFTLASQSLVSEIYFYGYGYASPWVGWLVIREDDGGSPGDPVTGLIVSVSSGSGWTGGVVASPATIAAGTYWIVLEAISTSAYQSEYVIVGLDSGDGYGQTTLKNTGSWGAQAGDMAFRVIGNVSSSFDPPVPTGLNMMKTLRKLVAFAKNSVFYET